MLTVLLVSLGALFYVLVGYPVLLLVLWRVKGRRPLPTPPPPLRVDFLIPAHNEQDVIVDKINNTFALSNTGGHRISVVVVSDGSTDATVPRLRAIKDDRLRVLETATRSGKLGALNQALDTLTGDVVVFSDANAILVPGSLDAMIRHFGDPKVGGVCGQISIDQTGDGAIAQADNAFWRYDQAMKHAESDLGGTVSAQGSIYAVRRGLTGPIPPGVADDFLMSTRVVAQGYRLVFEPAAVTREAVTERAGDEMSRRVRSTEMGWRGLMMMRHLMNPWRTGLYAWQLFSHKFLRRLMPLFLVLALLSNLMLIGTHPALTALALAQVAFYTIGALAWIAPALRKLPLTGKILFFVMGNVAMALGLLAYFKGRKSSLWTPVRA